MSWGFARVYRGEVECTWGGFESSDEAFEALVEYETANPPLHHSRVVYALLRDGEVDHAETEEQCRYRCYRQLDELLAKADKVEAEGETEWAERLRAEAHHIREGL